MCEWNSPKQMFIHKQTYIVHFIDVKILLRFLFHDLSISKSTELPLKNKLFIPKLP